MKNSNRNQTIVAMSLWLTAAAFTGATLPARAQETNTTTTATSTTTPAVTSSAPADENGWRFGVWLPLWAPQINGDVTVRGHTEDVDISFSTLREHLDAAFSLGFSAQKDKFGLFTSASYMKFHGNSDRDSATLKFGIINAGLSYLLVKEGEERPFILAATAGIRYWYAGLDVTIVDPLSGVAFNGDKVEHLVDPVIGLVGSQYFTRRFHLDMQGDVGGFDISHDTDWTWSASGVLSYDFCKWFTLSAGYAALGLDEREGNDGGKNGLNLVFHGALIKAQVNF